MVVETLVVVIGLEPRFPGRAARAVVVGNLLSYVLFGIIAFLLSRADLPLGV
jgi:hypothetical protein